MGKFPLEMLVLFLQHDDFIQCHVFGNEGQQDYPHTKIRTFETYEQLASASHLLNYGQGDATNHWMWVFLSNFLRTPTRLWTKYSHLIDVHHGT